MSSAICTLFEGNYHYGLAALTNSLSKHNFKGVIYAGYKGSLPAWSDKATPENNHQLKGATRLIVSEKISICFIPLGTDYHLTNYKPDFMLNLFAGPCSDCSSLFYFDPDIVVKQNWTQFESWALAGVALCEDINSPLPRNHPRRIGWRTFYNKVQIELEFKEVFYANGGFIGINKADISFLLAWQKLQEAMGRAIGGLNRSSLPGHIASALDARIEQHDYFSKTDQDALNATIEASDTVCSFIGKESMEFKHGQSMMSHALGSPKPWRKSFIREALKGNPPSRPDKAYWSFAGAPIITYSGVQLFFKKNSLSLASIIGRFYSRS